MHVSVEVVVLLPGASDLLHSSSSSLMHMGRAASSFFVVHVLDQRLDYFAGPWSYLPLVFTSLSCPAWNVVVKLVPVSALILGSNCKALRPESASRL